MKFSDLKKTWKGYVNPFQRHLHRSVFSWMGFCLGVYKDQEPRPVVPADFSYPEPSQETLSDSPQVTWVNHSTFLIKAGDTHLLTDPIWSKRCSPVSFMGPKRRHRPGMRLRELPPIDIVLISHNHYDHLDKPTVKKLHQLQPDILWVIPKRMSRWFQKLGIENIVEFDWWDEYHLSKGNLKITAVPTQHFSGRHPLDSNKTPWNGYVMEFPEIEKSCYFVGDTGYNPIHFNEIGERFEDMDLSLIPIGTYSPKKFMQPVHIAPNEAVYIHREVGSKLSVGSHHFTFPLSAESVEQPPFDLFCAMEEAELDHNTFRVLKPGQTINW